MKINSVARNAIADKVESAIKREGLSKTEAADILGVKPDHITKLLSSKYRDEMSDNFFLKFQVWGNSGEAIRVWAAKRSGVYRPTQDETKEPPQKVGDDNPGEKVLTREEQDLLGKAHVKKAGEGVGALLRDEQPEQARIHADSPMDEVMNAVFSKVNEEVSLEKIEQLVSDWGKDLKHSEIILNRMDQLRNSDVDDIDRLGVVLQVINEIKEMGFDVDIHISPKQ